VRINGRVPRAVTSVLAAVLLGLACAAPAGAVRVGIADQEPAAFQDGRLRALGLKVARLVAPWDVATSDPAGVRAWLDAVAAAGLQPHVAFEHRSDERCPASPCRAPSRAQYAAAVRRFLKRFPEVRTFTTWNEANHVSQPTSAAPEAVAGYYEALRAACRACTVVAGDVVDSGSYVRWLTRFRRATSRSPRLWGLHNYGDVTYGTTSGTDAALSAVPGKLWIEETGGIVVRRDTRGRVLLAADETRAARGVERAFALARTRPRIARMYVYQWRTGPFATFDSGLMRPDGSARPSYAALVAGLRSLPRRRTTSTTWTARWAGKRTLRLRGACARGVKRCRGRLTVAVRTAATWRSKLRTRRAAVRAYRTRGGRRVVVLRVRVRPRLARRLRRAARRRLVLTVRSSSPRRARERLVLRLARPR
jgi:hypothetical protein